MIGFRDREPVRVQRCLQSLSRQTGGSFQVLFVDYGSQSSISGVVRPLVGSFPFAEYVYSDTRGQPWSRARALNIGIRRATAPFVLATDVDMVFDPSFVATILNRAAPDRALYCAARFLPRDFDRWEALHSGRDELSPVSRTAFGGCQCAATSVLTQIRGFDEWYRYWGAEDRDLAERLSRCGLRQVWLENETAIYHQWHPRQDFKSDGVLPPGEWGRIESYLIQQGEALTRNPKGWGEVQATDERRIFQFVDPTLGRILEPESVEFFSAPVHSEQATGELIRRLAALTDARVLAVSGSSLPRRRPAVDSLLRLANRAFTLLSPGTAIGYRPNLLHAALVTYIDEHRGQIADYYLDFPAMDGLSLVMKSSGAQGARS